MARSLLRYWGAKLVSQDAATANKVASAWPATNAELRPCMGLVALVYGVLVVAWQGTALPYLGTVLMAAAACTQLWLPIMRADHLGKPTRSLGLHCNDLYKELRDATFLAAGLVGPWAVVVWWRGFATHSMAALMHVQPWALLGAADTILTQVLGVALPEEVFWRGYVMQVLAARWPTRRLGLCVGGWMCAALFALGHLAQTPSLARLATFFPGLVFCWLMQRRKSIVGAWALHAACNLASAVVGARP